MPAARLTELVMVEDLRVLDAAAHSWMPGKSAGLRKPNGGVTESAVRVSVEPGVPMLVSRNGTIVLVDPVAVTGSSRG